MIHKIDAIISLDPNAMVSCNENSGEVIWYSENKLKITEEEIQAKIAELEAAEPLRLLRIERDRLIQQTDWRATVDYPNPDKQAWLDYRQALRDLPETADPQLDENGQLTNVIWPTPPT
jgi:hypothetical protein